MHTHQSISRYRHSSERGAFLRGFSKDLYGWRHIRVLAIVLCFGVVLWTPSKVNAHEWIDVVEDNSPLQFPTEILKQPFPENQATGPSLLFEKLQNDWFLRKRYIALGDQQVGSLLLKRIHEKMIDLGAVRLRPFAASLLREADYLADEGDYEGALTLCRTSSEFARDLPETHLMLANILWRQNGGNFLSVAMEGLRAAKLVFLHFDTAARLLMGLLFLLLVTSFVFFGVFYLAALIRYGRLLYHDLFELLPGEPRRLWLTLGMILLLISPLIVGGGLYGVFLLWLVLFWSYSTRKERFIHLLFLAFMVVAPLWMEGLHFALDQLSGERIEALVRHQDGMADDPTVAGLVRQAGDSPKDDALLFMLGTAYKKRGEYDKAKAALEKAIQLNGNEPLYYNNLGNTYYAMRDLKKAVEMYERAIEFDPKNAAFHFNLSAVQRELFQLKESDKEYDKARQLDRSMVSYYVEILGPGYNRMVIDTTLSNQWIWHDFLERLRPRGGKSLLSEVFLGRGLKRAYRPFFLLCAVFLIQLFRRRFGYSRRCKKCGVVFCKKCQSSLRPDPVCSQCAYIFEEGAGVEVKQRTRKIIEILGYKERKKERGRLFGILVPGGGHVYFGRLWIAFAVLFLVVSCFIYGFFWRLLPQGDMVIRAASGDARIWVVVPAMIVYLLSVAHLYRLRG